jgi:hypothetical protein
MSLLSNLNSPLKNTIKRSIFSAQRILGKKYIEYHHFPFDSLQPMPAGAFERFKEVIEFLEKSNINYRIADGTALGLYRDGNFIAHDSDLDFEILDLPSEKAFTKSFQRNFGCTLGRCVFYKGEIQQLVFYTSNDLIIDFVFWTTEGDNVFNYAERGFVRSQPLKYFSQKDYINFKGIEIPLPGNVDEFLEFRYGKDWRIPKTYKGDWKEECGDIKQLY